MKKTIRLTDEIAEVERELIMRKSFYQKQIESGRMTREKANWQYQVLGRVLGLYKSHVTEARQLMKNGRRFWIIGTIPGKEYKKAIKTVVEERKSI